MEVKKLICDVCGGQIEMQLGGKGICTSCGTPYSAEIIKDKIQEIRGTVKVDGPVETVKGDAEKERLLNMANNCKEKERYDDAIEIYNNFIKDYPNDWRGYWGKIQSTLLYYSVLIKHNENSAKEELYLTEDYEKAISYAPAKEAEQIIAHRQERYENIKYYLDLSLNNANNIRKLAKKHNYKRVFDEVLCSHVKNYPGILDSFLIKDYLDKYIAQQNGESGYSWNTLYYNIDILPEEINTLEREAIIKYNEYFTQGKCPLCYNHSNLNLFGRCKIHGKIKKIEI